MAAITVNVPNAQLSRVADAFAGLYGYQDQIDGAPNPQTKAQFANNQLRRHVSEVLRSWEAKIAADSARDAAIAKADSEVTIT